MANVIQILTISGAFLIGLVLGSFASMASYRIPRSISWRGRSFCDICGKPLTVCDLIPVLSWAIRRGKCSCGLQPISVRYPLIELGLGLLCAGAAIVFGLNWALLIAMALAMVFVILLTIRIEYPDSRPHAQVMLALLTIALATALVFIRLAHS